ncbi:hypothetical protein [Streptomyces sp. NPDC056982]|uniref:hypothetical protein n=1 Tax=Streptomyces sp. NPDC056982 TaxID=3345986 RepID=UPI0036317F88
MEGEKTAHHKGTVTLDQMRESYQDEDAATRKRRDKNLSMYEGLAVDKLAVDLWIDQGDRTRRFRTRGAADKGRFDLTMTFFDYDKPVTVRAPAAKDVGGSGADDEGRDQRLSAPAGPGKSGFA